MSLSHPVGRYSVSRLRWVGGTLLVEFNFYLVLYLPPRHRLVEKSDRCFRTLFQNSQHSRSLPFNSKSWSAYDLVFLLFFASSVSFGQRGLVCPSLWDLVYLYSSSTGLRESNEASRGLSSYSLIISKVLYFPDDRATGKHLDQVSAPWFRTLKGK